MTQHSQNGEGVEVKPARYVEVDKGVFVAEDDYRGNGAEIRQSLTAREPATAGRGQRCDVPPPGWWCSRASGHEGPCAARPIGTLDVILDWHQGLKEKARQSISLHDLHSMAKRLAALSRAAPSSVLKGDDNVCSDTAAGPSGDLRFDRGIADHLSVRPDLAPSSGHAMAEGERPWQVEAIRRLRDDWPAKRAAGEWSAQPIAHIDDIFVGLLNYYEALATTPPTTNDAIPAGMVLVPVEPTKAMVLAGAGWNIPNDDMKQAWSAMLAAAPSAPTPKGGLPGRGEVEQAYLQGQIDMRERAATVCDERGAEEQEGFGLNRATQNYFRARNAVRDLEPAALAPAEAIRDGGEGGEG